MGSDDFDAALRSFHSTVDYATTMVGYTKARSDPSLDGSEYDTVFSIMEAIANPNPGRLCRDFPRSLLGRIID